MHTIRDSYANFIKNITAVFGNGEAQSIARIAFEDAFKIYQFQSELPFLFTKELLEIQARLLKKEPIQYILGQADFYGLKFKVSPAVLIPRPETEELIYLVLEKAQQSNLRILDIGTGSGCIPITIKKKLPNATLYALDISLKALEIARKNAQINNVNIHFIEADILSEENWAKLPNIDIIISNPPYIPVKEKVLMPDHVLDYEPSLALFVEDHDPLIFYKKIGTLAFTYLSKGSYLFFECNEFNAIDVQSFLNKIGFTKVVLHQDMSGKDRMIEAIK